MLDFPVVPELKFESPKDKKEFEVKVLELVKGSSTFNSYYTIAQSPCSMEGIVTRNTDGYSVENFSRNVFKYVRKGHVKTDEHWTRNWKRAS